MGKLLRVMTVLILLLSGVALWFGTVLFTKRELLKGRTQKLEKAVVELSAFVEAEREEETLQANYPARDIDSVSSQSNPDPRTSPFWDSYAAHLEAADHPPVVLRRDDLLQYYKIDPVTLKVAKDASGDPVTTGKGTMQAAIDRLLSATEDQLSVLNATRNELVKVREELVDTIQDLNNQKRQLRDRLAQIDELNSKIQGLQNDVRRLESRVQELEDDKRELEDTVASQERKIDELNTEILIRDDQIASQKEEIKRLRAAKVAIGDPILTGGGRMIAPGQKGKVVSVNADWSYVVMELNPDFVEELQAIMDKSEGAATVPQIDLFVKRGPNFKTFVSKVRLVQIKKDEKLGVADILIDWQQLPVVKGDIIFF